ncbi:MAG: GHKL domain-containing protein [Clostridia bacterium]|nr:GHKL domain-containing protein [Clostridia bacterium]
MLTILAAFSHIVEFVISFSFLKTVFRIKSDFEKKILPYLSAIILCFWEYVAYIVFDSTIINIFSFFVAILILSLVFFNTKIVSATLVSIFLSIALTASEFLTMSLLSLGLGGGIETYKSSFLNFAITVIISRLIFCIITKMSEYAGFYLQGDKNVRIPVFLFLYPSTAIVILYIFWSVSAIYNPSRIISITIALASFAVLVSVFLTFTFYSRTSKKMDELYKEQSEAEKIKTDTAYYAILDKQNETLAMLTHDEKNHLLAIKAIANNPEVDEYINKVYGEIKEISMFGNTNNKYLDLLINKYQTECETNGIYFDCSIKTANLSFMDSTDLISIIGNILDNAVEAAENSKEKSIILSINKNGSFDILSCSNSCDHIPLIKGGKLITSKKTPGIHGYGIKSIIKTAEKYGGEVEWTYNDNIKTFSIIIVFTKNENL